MIPPFSNFLSACLPYFTDGLKHTKDDLMKYYVDLFNLVEDDCKILTRQGSKTQLDDRATWALTYLMRAGILVSNRNGRYSQYSITETGLLFQKKYSNGFTQKDLEQFPSFLEFQTRQVTGPVTSSSATTDSTEEKTGWNELSEEVDRQSVIDIYQALDNLKKMGLPISEEQYKYAEEQERKYIETVVVPKVHQLLSDLMLGLRHNYDMYGNYSEGRVSLFDIL